MSTYRVGEREIVVAVTLFTVKVRSRFTIT